MATLKERTRFSGPVLPLLLWLNSMNFVEREEVTTRLPVIRAKWRITAAGRTFLAFTGSHKEETFPYTSPAIQVLLVAPHDIRERIRGAAATDLYEALVDILATASDEVLISSPYIDELIVPLLRNVREDATVKILTENASKPIFKRLVDSRTNTEVRYLRVMDKQVQLFQVHAKFVCVDRKSAIITSANINERSLNYNIEVGVLFSDRRVCEQIAEVFDGIFAQASKI